jgi:hypothetical protein
MAAVLVLLAVFVAWPARGADVPIDVQLALYVNVWKLDRNFGDPAAARIAIVYQETNSASTAMKNEAVRWIAAHRGLEAVPIALDRAGQAAALENVKAHVFYVMRMRGADLRRIAEIARARRIRTMSGDPEYVGLGLSVGIAVRNDRPLILIDLAAARAEGADYESRLLRLAEIVNQ